MWAVNYVETGTMGTTPPLRGAPGIHLNYVPLQFSIHILDREVKSLRRPGCGRVKGFAAEGENVGTAKVRNQKKNTRR
jgi:hypothetical protein